VLDPANFVRVIDNPYYPLPVGRTLVYRGIRDGVTQTDRVHVTSRTKVIEGITATTVTDVATHGRRLLEKTTDWFAQDKQGNVWYLGEDTAATVEAGLSSRAGLLASELRRGNALADIEPAPIERDEAFAQIAEASGRIVQSSSIISRQRLLPAAAVGAVSRAGKAQFVDRGLRGIDYQARVLAVPVTTARGRFVVMVGASLQDREDELVALAATLAIAGTIAICLISLAAWLAVTGALRPVERMRRQAAAISAWDPGRRLSVWAGKDELALLGGTLNQMLDRIEDSVERERQLVDRASHQLRTPLAVQRIDLDLALSGPQTVAELQAALRSVSQENQHLTRLTEDLLVLARVRGGELQVQPPRIPRAADRSVRPPPPGSPRLTRRLTRRTPPLSAQQGAAVPPG
jgi:signal transduction histidine kinase